MTVAAVDRLVHQAHVEMDAEVLRRARAELKDKAADRSP
jgi:hypothetical protein